MADLTITAANVVRVTGLPITKYAGAAILQGQCVYLDEVTNTLKLADADVLASSIAVGIALNAAAIGQPCSYLPADCTITIGATVVVGLAYYVSATAGGICPEADLTAGDFAHLIGFATSTTVLALHFKGAGVAKA